jgi:hypothetical protein
VVGLLLRDGESFFRRLVDQSTRLEAGRGVVGFGGFSAMVSAPLGEVWSGKLTSRSRLLEPLVQLPAPLK